MESMDLLLMLIVSGINFWIAHDVIYKVYHILMGEREFQNSVEKFGFYIHGWLSYTALMVLITCPLWTQSWAYGLMGTGFLIILRILLRGKL